MPATARCRSRRGYTIFTGSSSSRHQRVPGSGSVLIQYVEQDVLSRGGRMILIETSSQETYGATIRFYERSGYYLSARIRNFYKIGDDKLVFQKELY